MVATVMKQKWNGVKKLQLYLCNEHVMNFKTDTK